MKQRDIESLSHPLVKRLVRLREDSAERLERGTVLIQGRKVVAEVGSETTVRLLLVSDERLVPRGLFAQELIITSEAVMQKVAGVRSAEGIVAEVQMPAAATLQGLQRVVVLDGVADPGNLGTLLRTALALGWQGAYLLQSCCDPYNDKALRAAMGATFRIPLRMGTADELAVLAKTEGWRLLAADLRGSAPETIERKQKVALILGSEAHGVSQVCQRMAQPVAIPMPGSMESLNVSIAGAILMYLLRG